MDVGQARDYLYSLSGLPAMKAIKEHEETLEEISCLLDDLDSFLQLMDQMPDFEPEDRTDQKWIEKVKLDLEYFNSRGDKQFLENVVKKLQQ
jgi:hypothetical protein